jgi:hypothetical protein
VCIKVGSGTSLYGHLVGVDGSHVWLCEGDTVPLQLTPLEKQLVSAVYYCPYTVKSSMLVNNGPFNAISRPGWSFPASSNPRTVIDRKMNCD